MHTAPFMRQPHTTLAALALGALGFTPLWIGAQGSASTASPAASAVQTAPGMPPVPDRHNLYSETAAGKMSPAVRGPLVAASEGARRQIVEALARLDAAVPSAAAVAR